MAAKRLPDQSYLRECFDYEADEGILTWKRRPKNHFATAGAWKCWNSRWPGLVAGTVANFDSGQCIAVTVRLRTYLAHRIIWKMLTNEEPPQIDHEDGRGLNNRKRNLRASDAVTNHQNVKNHADHPYPKGVYRNRKRWRSHIMARGVLHYLGTFDTQEEAHAVYCEAATRLHGKFANFGHARGSHVTDP